MSNGTMKLNVTAIGLALGVVYAIGMFVMGLIAMYFDVGNPLVELVGTLYIGYNDTIVGSLIGAGWGFLDGFVFGVIFAWFYNLVAS